MLPTRQDRHPEQTPHQERSELAEPRGGLVASLQRAQSLELPLAYGPHAIRSKKSRRMEAHLDAVISAQSTH